MSHSGYKKKPGTSAGFTAIKSATSYALSAMSAGKAISILKHLNQKDGIDCPGCAWPDPNERSKLGEFCENGVKAITEEAMSRSLGRAFFQKYSIEDLKAKEEYWLSQQGRLTEPMIKREGETHYTPIDWQEVYTHIAGTLKSLDSPNQAVFYTSGRTSNEAAFLYQLFVRMLGTNNMPDCSNMCHESSGVGLKETVGIGKGSVTLEDLYKSELILIIGQNPGTNHPRMLSALEKAKKHGAKIVTINPLKEVGLEKFKNPQSVTGIIGKGVEITDLYLQVKVNEDTALLKYVMKRLIERAVNSPDSIDSSFINDKTKGYDELKSHLESLDEKELLSRTGLSESEVNVFVELLTSRKRIIACWAMGLTQHKNGVDNIREVVNLLLLKGSIGKEGAGTCPVRGHSNVQGDRTVGIVEKPSSELLDRLAANFGFSPPVEAGYNTVEAIEAMDKGKVRFFMGLGGNFYSATPDSTLTGKALANCDVTVHISTKLNRSHLMTGKTALILPCLGRTDRIEVNGIPQKLSVENSMGVVHSTQGFVRPQSNKLKSEPEIIAGIAQETLGDKQVQWNELVQDYSKIRDLIDSTIPGFENYNERIEKGQGFDLPNGARIGKFNTASGKAHFTINRLSNIQLRKNELLLTTVRSHDQFNTTIYGLNDRYRGIENKRRVLFIHTEDIKDQGFKEGDQVDLVSTYSGEERVASTFTLVPYDIPRGCVASYFPETNVLVPLHSYADGSYTPTYKSIIIKLRKND